MQQNFKKHKRLSMIRIWLKNTMHIKIFFVKMVTYDPHWMKKIQSISFICNPTTFMTSILHLTEYALKNIQIQLYCQKTCPFSRTISLQPNHISSFLIRLFKTIIQMVASAKCKVRSCIFLVAGMLSHWGKRTYPISHFSVHMSFGYFDC